MYYDEPPADFDVLFVPASCLRCGAEVLTLHLDCRPGRHPATFDRAGSILGHPAVVLHGCCREVLAIEDGDDWADFDPADGPEW